MINLISNIIYPPTRSSWLGIAVTTALILSACQPQVASISSGASAFGEDQLQNPETVPLDQESSSDQSPVITFPKRPRYSPGQLVDYTAQPGDTLPLLAVRFNTTVEGILEANPFIPKSATTMPSWYADADSDLLPALVGFALPDYSRQSFCKWSQPSQF